jgi:hypothetical protein
MQPSISKKKWYRKMKPLPPQGAEHLSQENHPLRQQRESAFPLRSMMGSVTAPILLVHCSGCRTSRSIDLRTIDRHPLASFGGLMLGQRCT